MVQIKLTRTSLNSIQLTLDELLIFIVLFDRKFDHSKCIHVLNVGRFVSAQQAWLYSYPSYANLFPGYFSFNPNRKLIVYSIVREK